MHSHNDNPTPLVRFCPPTLQLKSKDILGILTFQMKPKNLEKSSHRRRTDQKLKKMKL
ncbi:hypothetical protein IC575_015581 [Cucumis melo]